MFEPRHFGSQQNRVKVLKNHLPNGRDSGDHLRFQIRGVAEDWILINPPLPPDVKGRTIPRLI